jgi:hypothetical protein
VAGLLLGMAISFDVHDSAARGTPSWSDALDAAAAECRRAGPEEVTVPISPTSFELVLPCSKVPSG